MSVGAAWVPPSESKGRVGGTPGSVPTTLGRLRALREGGGALEVASNQLSGPFPAWLLSDTAITNGTTLELQARSSLAFLTQDRADAACTPCHLAHGDSTCSLLQQVDGRRCLLTSRMSAAEDSCSADDEVHFTEVVFE